MNLDVVKQRSAEIDAENEQVAEEEAARQAEENRPWYEKAWDMAKEVGATITDPATYERGWDLYVDSQNRVNEEKMRENEVVGNAVVTVASDIGNAVKNQVQAFSNMVEQRKRVDDALRAGDEDEAIRISQSPEWAESVEANSEAQKQLLGSPFKAFVNQNAENPYSPLRGLTQGLQVAGLEYFMTDEDKASKAQEIQEKIGIPAEITMASPDTMRSAMEIMNYADKAKDLDEAGEKYQEVLDIAKTNPEEALQALHNFQDVKTTHGIIDSFNYFWERGNERLEYGRLQYKIMNGEATQEEIDRANYLSHNMETYQKEAPSFFADPLGAMAAGVAGSAPEMLDTTVKAAPEAAAITLAAVALTVATGGTDLLVAGASAGVAAGIRSVIMRTLAKEGMKQAIKSFGEKAFTAALVDQMTQVEAGVDYGEMKNAKVQTEGGEKPLYSDSEARNYAYARGFANSLLEVVPTVKFLKTTPQAARVFADSISLITDRAAKREGLRDLAAASLGNIARGTLTESGEEAAQSVADDLIMNQANSGKNGVATYSAPDILARAGKSFAEALPGSLGFGVLGTAGGSIVGAGRIGRMNRRLEDMERTYGQNAQKTMMGSMMVEQLQQATQKAKLNKVAPEVQKKVLREQLKGTGYEMAYVDTEMAAQKEHGMEDLKAVAKANDMTDEQLQTAIEEKGQIAVPVETLAQVKASPDLLDTISFDKGSESMARMRENAKNAVERYRENAKKAADKQMALIDTVAKEYMPDATEAQKQAIRDVIQYNPANPAQGWKELHKGYQDVLDEKIAPALRALREGMGQGATLIDTAEDASGRKARISNNDEWYQQFYADHGRAPSKQELEDMAVQLTTGDPNAPKVPGWVPDSEEMHEAMAADKADIESIRKAIAALDAIKEPASKLNGVEMELTQGLSPEAYRVYRHVTDWGKKVGGPTGRQARMGALLVARHADIVSKIMREKKGLENYTAEDYMKSLGFQIGEAKGEGLAQRPAKTLREQVDNPVKQLKISSDTFAVKPKGKKPVEAALSWFAKRYPDGANVRTSGGNIVKVTKRSIKDSLSHGMRKKKIAVIPTLIEGLQQSVLLRDMKDYEKPSVRYQYYVYQVMLDGERNYVLCRAKVSENGTRLYIHEVATEDEINKMSKSLLTRGVAENGRPPRGLALYTSILYDFLHDFNRPKAISQPLGKMNPTLHQMAGENAKTANLQALQRAKDMERAGKDADIIWNETGWTKGRDGKWRFEIPDNLDKVNFDGLEDETKYLKDVYDNPALYAAYPDLAYVLVQLSSEMGKDTKGATVGDSILLNTQKLADKDMPETLIHEIQHLIQHREGFASGGAPSAANRLAERLRDKNFDAKQAFNQANDTLRAIDYVRTTRNWEKHPRSVLKSSIYLQTEKAGMPKGREAQQEYLAKAVEDSKRAWRAELLEKGGFYSLPELESMSDRKLQNYEKTVRRVLHNSEAGSDLYDEMGRFANTESEEERYEFYKRLAGEQEAYMTEERAKNATAEEANRKRQEKAEKALHDAIKDLPADQQKAVKDFISSRDYDSDEAMAAFDDYPDDVVDAMADVMSAYSNRNISNPRPIPHDAGAIILFGSKPVASVQYNQAVSGAAQGFTQLMSDGTRVVHVLETADESTFMHEMAHVFYMDLQNLSQIDDVSANELGIVDGWAEWHKGAAKEYKHSAWAKEFRNREKEILQAEKDGYVTRSDGKKYTAEMLKREWKQERFARGFEMYLRDGKAPAKGLQGVFRKFKSFLRTIYSAFVNDGGMPSIEVRRVMDRMIASEDEIDAAEINDAYSDYEKLGGEKLFGERDGETVKRWTDELKASAKEKLMARLMKDLDAKTAEEVKKRSDEERARYMEELQNTDNLYAAEAAVQLTGDEQAATVFFDSIEDYHKAAEGRPTLDEAVREHMDKYEKQLETELMEQNLSAEKVDAILDSDEYKAKIDEMVARGLEKKRRIVSTMNVKAQNATRTIEEKLKDIPDDAKAELDSKAKPFKEIMKAVDQLRFADKWTARDLRNIEKMMKAQTKAEVEKALEAFKEDQKRQAKDTRDITEVTKGNTKYIRDLARQELAGKPMTESCNVQLMKGRERSAARRVKRELKRGHWDAAVQAQYEKVFYGEAVKEARLNAETQDKLIKGIKRKLRATTVVLPKDERYWFNHLCYILRFTPEDIKVPEDGVMKLEDMFEEQKASLDLLETPTSLLEIAAQGSKFSSYDNLTLAAFSDIVDDLNRLYVIGRDKFKMKTMNGRMISDVQSEIINDDAGRISDDMQVTMRTVNRDTGGVFYSGLLGKAGRTGQSIANGLQGSLLSLMKPENLLKMLGDKAHQYIYGTLEKAAEREALLLEDNVKKMREICSMYSRKEIAEWSSPKYNFLGNKLSKEEVLCMALNFGTETNRQRLRGGFRYEGREVTDDDIRDFFNRTLTEKDWEFVQEIWNHINDYWSDTARTEEELNGVALKKEAASPFEVDTLDGKRVKMKGGYYPIKYNAEKSARANEQTTEEAARSILAGASRLGTNRGFTKSRTAMEVYRPLDLSFYVLEKHLTDVIHNISFRIPLRDVYRLLHSKGGGQEFSSMEDFIRNTLGANAYQELNEWSLDAWTTVNENHNSADSWMSRVARSLRGGSTLAIMGYHLKPCIQNITNIPICMDRIGAAKTLTAIADFWNPVHVKEAWKKVMNLSVFMRNRKTNMDRDMRQQQGMLHAGNRLADVAKEHAYDAMVFTDLMVSMPVWLKAYKDALPGKLEEATKERTENLNRRMELQNRVDEVRAGVYDHQKAAKDIDDYLHTMRYGSDTDRAALQNDSRYTGLLGVDDVDLRAARNRHTVEARKLSGKDLLEAETLFESAQGLPVWTDEQLQEEASRRAVLVADGVVRDTIGSGRTIDQPSIMRSRSEFTRLFTAFYSFFNTQYNELAMAFLKSRHQGNGIVKWAPFAKTIMYRVVFVAVMDVALNAMMGQMDSDDDKKKKVKDADGKTKTIDRPLMERVLMALEKDLVAQTTGGLPFIRDIAQIINDKIVTGNGRDYALGSVLSRSASELARAFALAAGASEKNQDIAEKEAKHQAEYEYKLAHAKNAKARQKIQQTEEEYQKYHKKQYPTTVLDIARHAARAASAAFATKTGITSDVAVAPITAMQYINDTDMRYDASIRNFVWSILYGKNPVERETPEKPEKPETAAPKGNKAAKKKEDREAWVRNRTQELENK